MYLPYAVCLIFIQEIQSELYQRIHVAAKTLLTQSERPIRSCQSYKDTDCHGVPTLQWIVRGLFVARCIYIYIYMCVCVCVCVRARAREYIYIYMCVCVCVCEPN